MGILTQRSTETMQTNVMYKKLIDRGIITIPLAKGTKRPMVRWGQYLLKKPAPEIMLQWFIDRPDCDVAILTGMLSGVMCLDFDKPPYINGLFTKTPSGGRHYFYKHESHHRHSLGVRNGLDIPYIVKIYGNPTINKEHMPINGSAPLRTTTQNSKFIAGTDIPEMKHFEKCDFIHWFRARRNYDSWGSRYSLARSYAANVACAKDPDLRLGNDYQHQDTIIASLLKPHTCRTIVSSGYPCQYFDRYSGFCTRDYKSKSPYGLALQECRK